MSNKKYSSDGLFRPRYTFLVAGGELGRLACLIINKSTRISTNTETAMLSTWNPKNIFLRNKFCQKPQIWFKIRYFFGLMLLNAFECVKGDFAAHPGGPLQSNPLNAHCRGNHPTTTLGYINGLLELSARYQTIKEDVGWVVDAESLVHK